MLVQDVFIQAATQGDVDDLQAAANPQEWQACLKCILQELNFYPIAILINVRNQGMGVVAILLGVNVAAASEENPIQFGN